MIKPLLFTQSLEATSDLFAKLKTIMCPHCKQWGWLIRNGKLKGNEPQSYGNTQMIRGQRLLCSARSKRQGCGRSLTVYLGNVLPKMSITAQLMLGFIKKTLQYSSVHAGWSASVRCFSLSSAYRWWRSLNQNQTRLRQYLCQQCEPPPCQAPLPLQQLFEHLKKVFNLQPIESFQLHFQQNFWTT